MSLTLCGACAWVGPFSSNYNHCFGLWVMHLEDGCFNFWGLRLLLRLPLTIGLTSDALTYSHPLDWELKFNPRMLHSLRLWVGGVYLYPSFFTSFPISNHNHRLLDIFFSQKNVSFICQYTFLKMLIGGSEVLWGPCPFGPLRMYSAWPLPEP